MVQSTIKGLNMIKSEKFSEKTSGQPITKQQMKNIHDREQFALNFESNIGHFHLEQNYK